MMSPLHAFGMLVLSACYGVVLDKMQPASRLRSLAPGMETPGRRQALLRRYIAGLMCVPEDWVRFDS